MNKPLYKAKTLFFVNLSVYPISGTLSKVTDILSSDSDFNTKFSTSEKYLKTVLKQFDVSKYGYDTFNELEGFFSIFNIIFNQQLNPIKVSIIPTSNLTSSTSIPLKNFMKLYVYSGDITYLKPIRNDPNFEYIKSNLDYISTILL